jgi:hypothetical protein
VPQVSSQPVAARRYVTPFREGGSLPALVEAADGELYVVKFRGAGQGSLALVAELVAGELARALGLPIPRLALIEVDDALGRAEPDPEIQELVQGSVGTNVGLEFLPGASGYSPAALQPSPELAAEIVWFDAFVTNVDRTPRNVNLLEWEERLWLIDHGAAFYLQHGGLDPEAQAGRPFPMIAEHVLLPVAGPIEAAADRLRRRLDRASIERIVAAVPADWFTGSPPEDYVAYLAGRLEGSAEFTEEAERARRGI